MSQQLLWFIKYRVFCISLDTLLCMCNALFNPNTYAYMHTSSFYVLFFWRGWCAQEGVNDTICVISSEEGFHSWNFFRVCNEKSCASYSLGEVVEDESLFPVMLLIRSCYSSSKELYLRHLKRMLNYLENICVKLLVLICVSYLLKEVSSILKL